MAESSTHGKLPMMTVLATLAAVLLVACGSNGAAPTGAPADDAVSDAVAEEVSPCVAGEIRILATNFVPRGWKTATGFNDVWLIGEESGRPLDILWATCDGGVDPADTAAVAAVCPGESALLILPSATKAGLEKVQVRGAVRMTRDFRSELPSGYSWFQCPGESQSKTPECTMGELVPMPANVRPQDWNVAQGQVVTISDQDRSMALFSLLGNRFGGDATQAGTFAYPHPEPMTQGGKPVSIQLCADGRYPMRAG